MYLCTFNNLNHTYFFYQNNALVDTCNESIIKLNEEKESTFRLKYKLDT